MVVKFIFKKDKLVETSLLLAKKGLTRNEFATNCGISKSYLSQILNNRTHAGSKAAFKISNQLNMEIDDLFFIK